MLLRTRRLKARRPRWPSPFADIIRRGTDWAKTPAGEATITSLQRKLYPLAVTNHTRRDYLRCARWLELEAKRGYGSSADSWRYARNMRWAAELVGIYGPGTWLELIARAGVKNPEDRRLP